MKKMVLFQVSIYRCANPDSLTLFLVYRGDHYIAQASKGTVWLSTNNQPFLYLAQQNSDLLYKLKSELTSPGLLTYVCSPRRTGSPWFTGSTCQTASVLLSEPWRSHKRTRNHIQSSHTFETRPALNGNIRM